jgi:hypothetical protein
MVPYKRPLAIYKKKQASPASCSIDDLVTGCFRCISDIAYAEEVKNFTLVPLIALPERREQYKIMREWQKKSVGKNAYLCEELLMHWDHLINRKHTQEEYDIIYNLMSKFSYNTLETAMNIAQKQYLNNNQTTEAVEKAVNKIGGIAYNLNNPSRDRHNLNYIIGILRNRGITVNEVEEKYCKGLINDHLIAGVKAETIMEIARQTKSYEEFVFSINTFF